MLLMRMEVTPVVGNVVSELFRDFGLLGLELAIHRCGDERGS